MKRSEFGKAVRLLKNNLIEMRAMGENEIMVKTSTPKKNVTKAVSVVSSKKLTLDEFNKKICQCKKCSLGDSRLKFVFGVGNQNAKLMFVGEGPGYDEDHKGEPFVGRAGQLLTKIIESIGMKREDVYIANIVKCHPMTDPSDPEKRGNDRPPTTEEANTCLPYLQEQIRIINPEFICALGNSASRTLLETELTIGKLRGKFVDYCGKKLLPIYHPAALLHNPNLKKDVWEDMKMLKKAMES